MMDMQMPDDDQRRKMVCLPLGMLNGWLFGIDANRVKDEIRDKVIQYQRECFDVLYQHFMPTVAALDYTRINPAQAQTLKELVNSISRRTGKHHQTIWTAFQSRFSVNSYLELAADRFEEACSYLGGKPVEVKPAQAQRFDIKGELLTGQSNPIPLTPDLSTVAEAHSWALASEAQQVLHQFILRYLAYQTNAEMRTNGKAVQAVKRLDLGQCLAHRHYGELSKVRTMLKAASEFSSQGLANLDAMLEPSTPALTA